MDEKEAEARPVMGTIFLVQCAAVNGDCGPNRTPRFYSYWASEASSTLGCSIEISRDICRYVVCLSYVKLTA